MLCRPSQGLHNISDSVILHDMIVMQAVGVAGSVRRKAGPDACDWLQMVEELFMAVGMSVVFALPVYYLCQLQGSFFVFWLAWLISLADGIGMTWLCMHHSLCLCTPCALHLACSSLEGLQARCQEASSSLESLQARCQEARQSLKILTSQFLPCSICVRDGCCVSQHGHRQLRAADVPHRAALCGRLCAALGGHSQVLDLVRHNPCC